MNAIDKIKQICNDILSVTDEELKEAENVARNQMEYFSPLKNATMGWQYRLGEYNMEVLTVLRNLRDTIKKGENIEEPRGR